MLSLVLPSDKVPSSWVGNILSHHVIVIQVIIVIVIVVNVIVIVVNVIVLVIMITCVD